MKKLKAKFKSFIETLQKAMPRMTAFVRKTQAKVTISMNKKPIAMTILILLLANIVILFITAAIGNAIEPAFNGFWDAFLKGSLRWMLSPHSINTVVGTKLTILAGATIAIEMVLFSGVIIAMTTNGIRVFLNKKADGKGKLILENHIVIMNWNSRVPEIIADLMTRNKTATVLLLSNRDKDFVKAEINDVLRTKGEVEPKAKISFIARQGDPLLRAELEEICLKDAESVIIMERDDLQSGENQISANDLYSLKLLLNLGSFQFGEKTKIIVEVDDAKTIQTLSEIISTVETLKDKNVLLINFIKELGYIMAQALVHPRLLNIYHDLQAGVGGEFFETLDISPEDFLTYYKTAVPVFSKGRLYVFSENEKTVLTKREFPYHTDRRLTLAKKEKESEPLTVFVIGHNSKKEGLMDGLTKYQEQGKREIMVNYFQKDFNRELTQALNIARGEKELLILSDDSVKKGDQDANIFISLMHIAKNFRMKNEFSILAEVMDPKNSVSVKDFGVDGTVVSNRMISLLITHLVKNKSAKSFFESLLKLDDNDGEEIKIFIEKAENVLEIVKPLIFENKAELVCSFYYTFSRKRMLIGILKANSTVYMAGDLDEKITVTIDKDDQLIYIQ